MKIKNFKRLILSLDLVGNQPFYLKFNMYNDQTLGDLVKLTKEFNAKHNVE